MKTTSNYQYQAADVSGHEVRFHWNIETFTEEDTVYWTADEALCLLSDASSTMISKMLAEGCPADLAESIVNDFKQEQGDTA